MKDKVSQLVNGNFGQFPLAVALLGFPTGSFRFPFGKWKRLSSRPIIAPSGSGFQSAGTFNPAVVMKGNEFVMLYRAQNRHGTSTLGYATSRDGIHFEQRLRPLFASEAPYEKGGGCEDPRLQRFGKTWYMTYTGYNNVNGKGPGGKDAQLCLATSEDLIHWRRHGVIMPAYVGKWNIGWTKSGAMVPEKINGKYWMYYLGDTRSRHGQMGLAVSEDLLHWKDATNRPVIQTRRGYFDSQVTEPGPPPGMLPEGILLVYNGANDKLIYSTGWALFDRRNPAKVIARSRTSIFHPVMRWEKVGQTPSVVFVEGLVRTGGKWLFYYGAADKYVGVAAAEPRSGHAVQDSRKILD